MSFLRKRTFVVHVQFYNEAAENDVLLSDQRSCLVKEKAVFVLKSFSFMSFSDNVSRVALTIKSLNNVNKIRICVYVVEYVCSRFDGRPLILK